MSRKTLLFLLMLLPVSFPVVANENWRETGYQMKLIDLLDRKDGYCLDLLGSGNMIRFDTPVIAHNCKEGLYADEAVVHKDDGTIYFAAYGGCLTAMGVNRHALPYSALMVKKCNVDEPFLRSTMFQEFRINKDNQVQLKSTNLCITVGDISRETYSSEHRWRSLYMQDCSVADKGLSQWRFIKPKA